MKTKLGILILVLVTALAHAQTNDLTSLLQQGLMEEQANRNLDAAIADYQTLAAQFDKNRQIAATAIFRLGECYRMLGKTNEAAAQYQRILKVFSDQQTLATLSRQNLTGMNLATIPSAMAANGNSAAALWDKLKGMSKADVEKILPTLVPDPVLDNLLQSRNETAAKLAQLKVDYAPDNLNVVRQQTELDEINRQIDDKISGMMQALKTRAELGQSIGTINAPIDEESQEIQRIQTMIQNSPDLINAPDSHGQTPLERAAYNGWLKVAAFLLDHGADINARGDYALFKATSAGNRAMVELLLSRGANVNANNSDTEKNTPLHIAVTKRFQTIVEVLLSNKADVNAQTRSGYTPLILAARESNPKIVSMLVEHKADVNAQSQDGLTPLISAAYGGQLENMKLLLAAGANPNLAGAGDKAPMQGGLPEFRGRTALSFAAGNNSPEMVKLLLDAKADPNAGKDLPLNEAASNGSTNILNLLLTRGANPNAKGAVSHNVSVGNAGPYTGDGNWSPLFLAVIGQHSEAVKLLIQAKADLNGSDFQGVPLIFFALSDPPTLKALLEGGADPNKQNKNGNSIGNNLSLPTGASPLEQAISIENREDIKMLLSHGADVNSRNPGNGETPLHCAVMSGQSDVVKLLLENKADPNVRDNNGFTPLDRVKQWQNPSPNQPFPSAIIFGRPSSQLSQVSWSGMASLLRQHGALDVLPDWDHISVSRPSANFSKAFFEKGTNDWNQISLFDVLGVQYNLISAAAAGGEARYNASPYSKSGFAHNNRLAFPDFANVVIRHPSADGKNWETRKVDLVRALDSGDGSADVLLQWGDVVEIPEADHVINQRWTGLTTNQLLTLKNCLARHLQITVNGRTTNFVVSPQVTIQKYWIYGQDIREISGREAPPMGAIIRMEAKLLTGEPFMLWPVLDESKTLLASSDLSRVQIKRTDATGKVHEWTVDCSDRNSPPNFWLRDGDEISVPEK